MISFIIIMYKALVSISAVVSAELTITQTFAQYVAKFGKNYATAEEYQMRFIEFAKTYQDILHFNAQPNQTSTVGLNKFADWTAAERKQIANYRPRDQVVGTTKLLDTADLPTEVDWIKQGAVNAVQDQGQCGSCWAFSAIAQMEGQHFIQSGKLLKLSEQQCVDCDSESFGCNGGW